MAHKLDPFEIVAESAAADAKALNPPARRRRAPAEQDDAPFATRRSDLNLLRLPSREEAEETRRSAPGFGEGSGPLEIYGQLARESAAFATLAVQSKTGGGTAQRVYQELTAQGVPANIAAQIAFEEQDFPSFVPNTIPGPGMGSIGRPGPPPPAPFAPGQSFGVKGGIEVVTDPAILAGGVGKGVSLAGRAARTGARVPRNLRVLRAAEEAERQATSAPKVDLRAAARDTADDATLMQTIQSSKATRAEFNSLASRSRSSRVARGEAALSSDLSGTTRLRRVGAAFRGEFEQPPNITPLKRQFKGRVRAAGEHFRSRIADEDDVYTVLSARSAFRQLWDEGVIPTKSDLAALEEVFGGEAGKRAGFEFFSEILNIPRAMLAAGELSASGRQAAPFMLEGGGQVYRKAFAEQLRAWKSPEAARQSVERIRANPMFGVSDEAGLSLATVVGGTKRGAVRLGAREEPFIGARLVGKIPVYGRLIRASERAYVTMLNEVRFYTFAREAAKLGDKASRKQLREIATRINALSGRADLGSFTEASTILNALFFAPRFAVSRFQTLGFAAQSAAAAIPGAQRIPFVGERLLAADPAARRLVARALSSYAGTVLGALALADLSGVGKVEWLDSRSSDFLKLKIGNTRIDPWAGLQQPVVLATRLARGEIKTTSRSEIMKSSIRDAIARFVQNKLNPVAGFVSRRGESFSGEGPLDPSPIPGLPMAAFDNFVFLFVQDIAEAVQEHGPAGLGIAPAAVLGVSSQTFGDALSEFEDEWRPQFDAYYEIETTAEARKKAGQRRSREKYRKDNALIDARLFLVGRVSTLQSGLAKTTTLRQIYDHDLLSKNLTPEVLALWAKVLTDPPSRLELTPEVSLERLRAALRSRGFKPRDEQETSGGSHTPEHAWEVVSAELGSKDFRALTRVWSGGTLTAAEEPSLRAAFQRHPLKQTNFKVWLKQTLRQAQEASAVASEPKGRV